MFDSIRKHQRLLQFILLILIFPAFAFFGIQGYDRFLSDGDSVAKVGDSSITRQEFELARQRQLEQMRQVFGGQVDPAMLDNAGARAEILEGLVTQRALMLEASDQRIVVSDDTLRRTILAIPDLVKADGSFDMERYRALLAAQGRNEAMFEAELRRDLAMQALPGAISQTPVVPDALVERVTRLGEQTREIRQRTFVPADFASSVDTSEEALKRYHEQNAAAFETPEQAKVEYLVLEPSAIEATIKLNPDEVRAYYEQNKARYATAEQRRASHILVTVPEGASEADKKAARDKAQALRDKLAAGADFAELAKAESQDPGSAPSGGDLGFFSASMMVKPFADAAFALKEGEISEVVESEFGYHVIKLTGIRPGVERAFQTVRAEIEAEIRKQQSAGRFAEAAESFSNLVYEQADTLNPAAERFGLKVETAEKVGRDGVESLPREHPLNQRRLLEALFSAESIANRRNTQAVDIGEGRLVSARIVEHSPARRQAFDEVRDEVRKRLVARESAAAARKAGEALLADLRAGKAQPDGAFGEARRIGRAPSDALPQPAVEAIFKVDGEKLPGYAGAGVADGGYAVFAVTKVIDADDKLLAERKPLYRRQLEQAYSQAALSAYVDSVKARRKIVRNEQAIAPEPVER
ncbi:SurA N-terminal domain-containing protein [Burkholderiaceae bacterium FT117]|uniref:SurA N-terminal domain-containing protein n=1 Tax=Zeimonas sediminis TaxID=2944268 RepID=UPI002342D008|nr:SurA N-terminal domain-containing protein [Zeimonas sediminis]MCM5569157.1 SurA N-terminal domain-containing protein [Zeimonas sediminis]